MESLQDALQPILGEPAPNQLVTLQGVLLAWPRQDNAVGQVVERALEIASHFHSYLAELQTKLTARQYSELASLLDIGAVGLVALESILFSEEENFWQRLILGGLAEGMMVAASRQYVKTWEAETRLVHIEAAWYLGEALWRTSADMHPDLAAAERWQAVQALLAPAYDAEVAALDKALLLGRAFQLLLLTHLAPLLATDS